MKRLPIGFSDYKEVIDDNFYYVDKTLFINDLLTQGGKVNLFPRPRRFGKTLNLSMLKYFFEKTDTSNAYLFEDKKIWSIPEAREKQGSLPVIFLTFKDVKQETWEATYGDLEVVIAEEFLRHKYLLDSDMFEPHEKEIFNLIMSEKAEEKHLNTSLKFLSRLLGQYHQSKVLILIDEYDAPIHEAFVQGYYEKVVGFMRSFLGGGLKDNTHLKSGVITGILRTAKEGIFSGLNNLEVFTLLHKTSSDKFGFTEDEIQQLLSDYHLNAISDEFKTWYNGYSIGDIKIYNPWSSISCVKNQGHFAPYWVNTSDNGLIKKVIAQAQPEIKQACAELIEGKALREIAIEDKMVLIEMMQDSDSIWNLLFFTGYLTTTFKRTERGICYADLVIPNEELRILFDRIIIELFKKHYGSSDFTSLALALEQGDGKRFEELVSKFMVKSMSFHDVSSAAPKNDPLDNPKNDPEISYHLFVLGLLVIFSNRYAVKSNRESGYGRYDIMLIPHDKTKRGIVIEFKKKDEKETLEECAERALEQIQAKDYATELRSHGVELITFFGIACHQKKILLLQA